MSKNKIEVEKMKLQLIKKFEMKELRDEKKRYLVWRFIETRVWERLTFSKAIYPENIIKVSDI